MHTPCRGLQPNGGIHMNAENMIAILVLKTEGMSNEGYKQHER